MASSCRCPQQLCGHLLVRPARQPATPMSADQPVSVCTMEGWRSLSSAAQSWGSKRGGVPAGHSGARARQGSLQTGRNYRCPRHGCAARTPAPRKPLDRCTGPWAGLLELTPVQLPSLTAAVQQRPVYWHRIGRGRTCVLVGVAMGAVNISLLGRFLSLHGNACQHNMSAHSHLQL